MFRPLPGGLAVMIAIYASCLLGQGNSPRTPEGVAPSQPVPVYRVTVVEHGIDAINYKYRAAPTKVDFRGTVLLSDAKGDATVQSRQGRTDIDARFEKLVAPTRFGREYLTYVLWAISPDGGSYNLGEVIPDTSDRAAIRVTTDLPAFGMIVTAEPYAAVRRPGDVVVLENHARPDTAGKVQQIQAKAELMPRGQYTWQVQENQGQPNEQKVSMSRYEALMHLYQAQNALGIAQADRADVYAPDAFAAAQRALSEAQRLNATKGNDKLVVQNAREAAQHAEDARLIAERRKQEEQRGGADREAHESPGAGTTAPAPPPASTAPASTPPVSTQPASTPPNQANREVREPDRHAQLLQQIDGSFRAQDTPGGVVITLPDDSFDGINLVAGVSERLAPLGTMLAAQPGIRVNVQAYTAAGRSELQSWERAQSVRDRLVASGVAAHQVAFRGMSAQANTRVEIIISGDQERP